MAVFTSGSVMLPTVGKDNFSDNNWSTIIKACQMNAVPESWNVGDQKPMTINGIEYLVDIIGKNRMLNNLKSSRASSSVLAVVTKIMSIPLTLSTLSYSISGKIICSLIPRV